MIRPDTTRARIIDCTQHGFHGTLTADQVVVYVADLGAGSNDPYKVGMTYYPGLTPEEAFRKRYEGHSNRSTPIIALNLIICDTNKGQPRNSRHPNGFEYDEYLRGEVIKAHRMGTIDFSAVVHQTSGNGNSERLLGFDPSTQTDQLIQVIKVAQGLQHHHDVRPSRTWRFGQEDVLDELHQILQSDGLALLAAYTGFGKTALAVETVARLLEPTGGLVLALTPISDTKDGFREALEGPYAVGLDRDVRKTFIDGKHLDRYDISALRARADAGEVIIIVSNVQDARYDDGNGALRDKYQPLMGLLNVIINDERHKEFNAALTSARLAELTAPYVLNLTATPYNVYSLFTREQVVSRTAVWALMHRAQTGVPQTHLHCLNTPLSAVDPIFATAYTAEEGFDPRKWFVRDNGIFRNEKALAKFATVAYDQLDSTRKNGCALNGRCGLWKCPDGQNGDSASEYLPALADLLNSTPRDVFFIDSFTLEEEAKQRYLSIGACVEALLREKGRVTVLTCEKFLTGTDIVPLDHIVLLDKMQSIANFEQLMGRLWRVCPGKDQVWFYCVQPNETLKVILGQLAKAQAVVGSNVTERDVLECLPLTYYQNGWKAFSIEDILTSVQEHFLSRLRDRIPAMTLAKDLLGSMHLLQEAPEGNFKGASVNIDALTDDTGAKVAKSNTKPFKKLSGQIEKTLLTKWVECFQTFSQEMRPAAWMTDVYDLDTLLRDKMLAEIFTAKDMKYIRRVLTTNEGLRSTFQSTLNEVRESFAGLSVEQALDSGVFLNTAQKVKKGLVFTPLELARKIVKRIRAKSPKRVLVVNANNGAFAFAAREQWPNAEVVCAETHSYYMPWLKRNGFTVDNWSEKMTGTFDVIVGNPPYQNATATTAKKAWKDITKKSLDMLVEGGYLLFITPPFYTGGTIQKHIGKFDIQFIDTTVKQFFSGIGSQFCAWMLKKQPNKHSVTVKTDRGEHTYDMSGLEFLPTDMTPVAMSLMRKFYGQNEKLGVLRDDSTHHLKCAEKRSTTFPYEVLDTNVKNMWSSVKPKAFTTQKVMASAVGYQNWFYNAGTMGVTEHGYWVEVVNKTRGARLVTVLNGKLYQVMMNLCKYSGFQNISVMRQLPAVDLTRDWTDEMLYKHFKLTKDEIAYVEAHAK